jgi:anthranilate synthase component 1
MRSNVMNKNGSLGVWKVSVRTMDAPADPLVFFRRLVGRGEGVYSFLFESADRNERAGRYTVGCTEPALRVTARGRRFAAEALNPTGRVLLPLFVKGWASFTPARTGPGRVEGVVPLEEGLLDEERRLTSSTPLDVLRPLAFGFRAEMEGRSPVPMMGGLFGMIAYDFVDCFERLPPHRAQGLGDPDYEFFLADRLFVLDHREEKLHWITLFPVAPGLETGQVQADQEEGLCRLRDALLGGASRPGGEEGVVRAGEAETDLARQEYVRRVLQLKEHILSGDIFQAVLSRVRSCPFEGDSLEVYRRLRERNPSPYLFYVRHGNGVLLGSSPETCLRVSGTSACDAKVGRGPCTVEIRPIAGTKPRGWVGDRIDPDLDSRYEMELKIDRKELAEHTMLVDLARNDIARVSVPGTRVVAEPMVVEKYSHVQHLVSNVRGVLRDGLDPFHAYTATMNMGTLTGAPKIEAMRLLRRYEENRRGFYGGAVGYVSPAGEMDTAIVIRSIQIKDGRAYLRAGAGIVADSDPESEFEETERKLEACWGALQDTQGLPVRQTGQRPDAECEK